MTAIKAWDAKRRTNAQLVVDLAALGYLHGDVYDPTFGMGAMWKLWQPEKLYASDIDPRPADERVREMRDQFVMPADYTRTMLWAEQFDSILFDPPYKLNGTSTGRGAAALDERYGVTEYASWQDRHTNIRMGITELLRLLKPGGYLIIKCQDQVCAGSVRWQTMEFSQHAEAHGAKHVDALFVVGGREQPAGRRQVHARRNYSTALVHRKSKR